MLATATDKIGLTHNLKITSTPKYQLFRSEAVFQ